MLGLNPPASIKRLSNARNSNRDWDISPSAPRLSKLRFFHFQHPCKFWLPGNDRSHVLCVAVIRHLDAEAPQGIANPTIIRNEQFGANRHSKFREQRGRPAISQNCLCPHLVAQLFDLQISCVWPILILSILFLDQAPLLAELHCVDESAYEHHRQKQEPRDYQRGQRPELT